MIYPWKLQEKILSPYKRDTSKGPDRNKLMRGVWATPEFEALEENEWEWDLKVDGVNCRINWDGIRVTVGGRTDDAQLNVNLIQVLQDMFPEEIMESVFGKSQFTLFGEGIGPKIGTCGGKYSTEMSFVLFDVFSYGADHQVYLKREDMQAVATSLGISHVPSVSNLTPVEAIAYVSSKSDWATFAQYPGVKDHEGLVGRPFGGFLARNGDRIAMKVKARDKITEHHVNA